MLPGERFKAWIDGLSESWKDNLRGWALRTISEGVKKFLEDDEPAAIDNVKEQIARLRANPHTPPEVIALLNRIEKGSSWFMIVIVVIMAIQMLIQTTSTLWVPTQKQMSYPEERVAQTFRFDPAAVITAWRRDKPTYEKYFGDLKDLGWSDDRIEALKFFTLFMPSAGDIVNWYAKEVYEPDMIQKYGLDAELPAYEETDFPKIGVNSEQATNFWRAHWEHASFIQMREMLHRKLITEEDFYEWFRLVEIVPFWRDNLIKIAYTWPTRVDVRRWWDMRTISEARLKELYEGMGYRGENLEDYIKWTKVYTDFPMMMTRFKNGWITEREVFDWLIKLGIPYERARQFIEEKTKPEKAERTTKEKDLTKTEIYKGVKKGLITWEQGIELLMDMGYDEDEADYILTINVGVLEGSPETFADFKDWTTKYKIATGRKAKPMPEELKKAADQLVKLTAEVQALDESIEKEKMGLIDQDILPVEATARLDELQVQRNRAISEQARVQSEYDSRLAEWRREIS